VQPQTEEVKPQQNSTPDLQTKAEKSKEVGNGFPDAAIFTRHLTAPKIPRIQMKLSIGKSGDRYEQEADRVAADVVQQNNGVVQQAALRSEPVYQPSSSKQVDVVQRMTHNGTLLDINTLNLVDSKEHLARLSRLANGAGKGTDNEYSYDPADKALLQQQIKTLTEQERATQLAALVLNLTGQLASLATAADFTNQPTWAGLNPQGAEGQETLINPALSADSAVVVARWQEFLGAGAYSHKHPRTGVVDPTRLVSADGQRSIRYGSHERNSSASNHHFHEETWIYDAGANKLTVQNHLRRVPVK
jgi:hypothetical protein